MIYDERFVLVCSNFRHIITDFKEVLSCYYKYIVQDMDYGSQARVFIIYMSYVFACIYVISQKTYTTFDF